MTATLTKPTVERQRATLEELRALRATLLRDVDRVADEAFEAGEIPDPARALDAEARARIIERWVARWEPTVARLEAQEAESERWRERDRQAAAARGREERAERENAAAAEWLRSQLVGEPVPVPELLRAAAAAGHSEYAVRAAARSLEVVTLRRWKPGMATITHGENHWAVQEAAGWAVVRE